MIKRNILILAALLLTFASFSQSSPQSGAILDKAYEAYEASQGIILSFTATTSEADGTTYMTQSGKAAIKGNRFQLEMEEMDIWFDGETQWVLMKEANEVNISNPTGQEIAAISPLALLGMYKNGYTLKAPLTGKVNGKNVYQIDMVPTHDRNDFKSVVVAIDKTTNTIVQVTLTMRNGMLNKIDITNYNANHQFSDVYFQFDQTKHPRVEIVDLR